MTAPKKLDRRQVILLQIVAIFLCGLIAWSIQQPAVSTWLQGARVLVADQENFEQLDGFTRKHLRTTKNLLKLKKRED